VWCSHYEIDNAGSYDNINGDNESDTVQLLGATATRILTATATVRRPVSLERTGGAIPAADGIESNSAVYTTASALFQVETSSMEAKMIDLGAINEGTAFVFEMNCCMLVAMRLDQ
jgi:hypothetical protein